MRCFKPKYIIKIITVALSICMLLSGCGDFINNTVSKNDIISQKRVESGKTPITILVKYAFAIKNFEIAIEKKFPNVDIIQVGNYTRDMGIDEYESRLEHDDLTDIVMTWPLDVGEKYWSERLMDLSAMNFTSEYSISMLNNISKNGKLYYIPGPSQVRGILYNKTLFKENGWELPTNFESFITLCKSIESSGIRSLQLGFANPEVLDTAFIGFNYANTFSSPSDIQKINDFNSGSISIGDHFSPALDIFQRMIDEKIFKPEDLNVSYSTREDMFFNRRCAMIEDSVLLSRMGYSYNGSTDEFAIMPFFNPTENNTDNDWSRLYMVCYIGLNKDLEKPENKDKYDIVMDIMEYISTPEGQKDLSADTGAMFSSLTDVPPPDIPEIAPLQPSLKHGRYAIFPTLKNAQNALRKGLAGMVSGELSKDEVIKMVDTENTSLSTTNMPQILGNATDNFTMLQTGNFVTDVMKEFSGCEIALFLDNGKDGRFNGKGLSGSLYKDDVTHTDLLRILPDLKQNEKCELWKVSMTGEDLIKTLEYSIPVGNGQTGWFYYFSGLNMEFDPCEEMGKRIKKITTSKGENIDPTKIYTIAVMDESVPNDFIKSKEDTNKLILDILSEYILANHTISPSIDNRFIIVK